MIWKKADTLPVLEARNFLCRRLSPPLSLHSYNVLGDLGQISLVTILNPNLGLPVACKTFSPLFLSFETPLQPLFADLSSHPVPSILVDLFFSSFPPRLYSPPLVLLSFLDLRRYFELLVTPGLVGPQSDNCLEINRSCLTPALPLDIFLS